MGTRTRWLLAAVVLGASGCGGDGTGPGGDNEGQRLAGQFDRLADSVDGAGYSATAAALRHAAEIVRLTGHATPVTLTIDGASRSFLAVAEQLDFPSLQCSWPSDSGVVPPGDTVTAPRPDSGAGTSPASSMDSVPAPGCVEVGTFSMRTLIAWEPEHMAEVVRVVADVGSNGVETGVPDVMTGLPTNTDAAPPSAPAPPPVPNDSGSGGGGGGGGNEGGGGGTPGGYPGFMGEYLVGDAGTWYAVEGTQANALESVAGGCSADRATFDWAEFACEAARFRFQFSMRVEPLRYPGPPTPLMERPGSPADPAEDHAIAMTETSVDGVRLSVIAWTPPPVPSPDPMPPDSTVTQR